MKTQTVLDVINDPVSQRLINSVIPARLAYNGLDGFPRVIPVGLIGMARGSWWDRRIARRRWQRCVSGRRWH
jgi:hypothetical protein